MELIGKVETDEKGMYSGMTLGLLKIVDEAIFDKELKDDEIDEYARKKFYQTFPYMAK